MCGLPTEVINSPTKCITDGFKENNCWGSYDISNMLKYLGTFLCLTKDLPDPLHFLSKFFLHLFVPVSNVKKQTVQHFNFSICL